MLKRAGWICSRPYAARLRVAGPGSSVTRGPLLHFSPSLSPSDENKLVRKDDYNKMSFTIRWHPLNPSNQERRPCSRINTQAQRKFTAVHTDKLNVFWKERFCCRIIERLRYLPTKCVWRSKGETFKPKNTVQHSHGFIVLCIVFPPVDW